jgi:hypothetical protein
MIIEVNLLTGKLDGLENLLVDFNELSARLAASDLEFVDETQIILNEREKVIDSIKVLQPEIIDLIDRQPPEKAAAIRKMLVGETVMSDFSEDEKAVQGKIISIRSLQSEIMQKEHTNNQRFKRKYDEAREELQNLQKEKKKLTFYQQSAKFGSTGKGVKYDSQN